MTLKEKIIEFLKANGGFTDREITDRIFGYDYPQQSVNIACRQLQEKGIVKRNIRGDGKIGNFLSSEDYNNNRENPTFRIEKDEKRLNTSGNNNQDGFSEDEIKQVLNGYLKSKGWNTQIAMGKNHGIDIDAYKDKSRWIIEVKGCGSRDAMRVNYFLAILGETLQRMNDPNAKYSIALPDLKQFRNLWDRLPRLAKDRTGITALFVDNDGRVDEVL